MKNSILTIFKKELSRFFLDKRLVLSIVLLPGLMIFIMYNFMGSIISKEINQVEEHKARVFVRGLPMSMEPIFKELDLDLTFLEDDDFTEEKQKIKKKEAELLVVFGKNFDEEVKNYDVMYGKEAPQVEIYHNSSKNESSRAFRILMDRLNLYEESLNNKFDINKSKEGNFDLASNEDMAGKIFGGMLPMLLMIFMWSGCISVAPESIAGEKERGTIATLLITPTKRGDIALGKILALSFIAFLSGASSFIGTFTALPALTKGMNDGFSTMTYEPKHFAMLFLIIVSTVLVLISLISVISGFAKSVKEAATLASPVMILVMLISFLPGILSAGEGKEPIYMYFIPLYNSVLCMNDIFKFHLYPVNILITVGMNLMAVVLLAGILTKLFNSEKVMFSK